MQVYFTDVFAPLKTRRLLTSKSDTSKFIVPKVDYLYFCVEAKDVDDHSSCMLCNVPIQDFTTICYVKTSHRMRSLDLESVYAVPIEFQDKFKKSKRKEKVGPIICPLHDERRPSAIRNRDGSVYCFHENRLIKKPRI